MEVFIWQKASLAEPDFDRKRAAPHFYALHFYAKMEPLIWHKNEGHKNGGASDRWLSPFCFTINGAQIMEIVYFSDRQY